MSILEKLKDTKNVVFLLKLFFLTYKSIFNDKVSNTKETQR